MFRFANTNERRHRMEHYDYRDPEMNGMNEYDRRTDEWHVREDIQDHWRIRNETINNTHNYYSGDHIHHCRTIQMYDMNDWNLLFGRETLNPVLRQYAENAIRYASQDFSQDFVPFAGHMEVSLLMEENYRPGVHLAVFLVYLIPHRQFYDGHVIQMEIEDGSETHQNINRLFDIGERAIVLQMSEYHILQFVADDEECMELLYGCFMYGFNPVRYSTHGYGFDAYRDDVYIQEHLCCHNEMNRVYIDDAPAPAPVPVPVPERVVDDYQATIRERRRQNNMIWNIIVNHDDDDLPARG